MYNNIRPEVSDNLSWVVPYNLWDTQYEALKAEYTNQFGLEFSKRAVVKPVENHRRFSQVLAEQALTFCQQMSIDTGGKEDDNIFKNCYGPMTSLLHNYFADYIKRVQAESEDAVENENTAEASKETADADTTDKASEEVKEEGKKSLFGKKKNDPAHGNYNNLQ